MVSLTGTAGWCADSFMGFGTTVAAANGFTFSKLLRSQWHQLQGMLLNVQICPTSGGSNGFEWKLNADGCFTVSSVVDVQDEFKANALMLQTILFAEKSVENGDPSEIQNFRVEKAQQKNSHKIPIDS